MTEWQKWIKQYLGRCRSRPLDHEHKDLIVVLQPSSLGGREATWKPIVLLLHTYLRRNCNFSDFSVMLILLLPNPKVTGMNGMWKLVKYQRKAYPKMYFYHLHTSLDSKVLSISVAVMISPWFFFTQKTCCLFSDSSTLTHNFNLNLRLFPELNKCF